MAEEKSWFLCKDCWHTLMDLRSTEPVNEFLASIRAIIKDEGVPRIRYNHAVIHGQVAIPEPCESCGKIGAATDGRTVQITVISHHLKRIRKMNGYLLSTSVFVENDKLKVELSFEEDGVGRKASGFYDIKYGKKSGKRTGTVPPHEFARLFFDACQITDGRERSALEQNLLQGDSTDGKFLSRARTALLKNIRKSLQGTDMEVFVQHVADKCKDRKVGRRVVEMICAKHRFSSEELEEMLRSVHMLAVHI